MSLTETKDMRLPKKLKTLRKKSGLTQGELAEKLRTSRQTVSYWETGAVVPTTDNLRFLSRLYGVSLDDLLDDGRELSQREAEQPKAPGPEEQARRRKRRRLWITVLFLVLALGIAVGILAVHVKDNWGVTDIRDIPGEIVELDPDNVIELD